MKALGSFFLLFSPGIISGTSVIVGGILKNGDMVKPSGQSKIEEGDTIALFALSKDIPEVERLLQVTIDYF